MLTFIHTYTNETFGGLLESGLWHDGDGLKLMHKTYYPSKYTFNEYARIGSLLNRYLEELKCPFYIDRLLGGNPLPYWYDYDPQLLRHYKNLLADDFWGFQMHEWASNYRSESRRIEAAVAEWVQKNGTDTLDAFWQKNIEIARSGEVPIFVEALTIEEWSKRTPPKSLTEFLENCKKIWGLRLQQTGGPLFPADSYYMAPKYEIAGGAKMLLPEVGWQIGETRFQIAYTRGMAKAAGIPWGIYYECWCAQDKQGLTIPFSANEAMNEWFNETDLLEQMCRITGNRPEQGGSSRSLQERAWLYAWFSGATVMGEEYGICNTFRDYHDFELSEYGLVKKRFLDLTRKYPNIGKTYTPIAIVLPAELDIYSIDERSDTYLGFSLENDIDPSLTRKIRRAREVIGALLHDRHPMQNTKTGSDEHCIQNSPFPDVFDVLHADQEAALAKYEYMIDLTGDSTFAAKHNNIVTVDELPSLLERLLPCTVSDDVHYTLNKTENGWLLLAINNKGVIRNDFTGDRFLPEAAIHARLRLRNDTRGLHVLEGTGALHSENGQYTLSLGAGQWLMLALY